MTPLSIGLIIGAIVVVGAVVVVSMRGPTAADTGVTPGTTPPAAGTDNTAAYLGLATTLIHTASEVYANTQTQRTSPQQQKG